MAKCVTKDPSLVLVFAFVAAKNTSINMTTNIQIPDIKKGHGLVLVGGTYYALHYENGTQRRTTTGTGDWDTAIKARDLIYRRLKKAGATVKRRLTPAEKLATGREDLYIHHRQPFSVVVKGKKLGEFATRKLAREARDRFLGNAEVRHGAKDADLD